MVKKAFMVALSLLLSIPLLAGMLSVEIGRANFQWSRQYTGLPTVSINQPANSSTLFSPHLDFKITRPGKDWLTSEDMLQWNKTTQVSSIESCVLTKANVYIDEEPYRSIDANSTLSSPFTYADPLPTLNEGRHNLSLQVNCEGLEVYYYPNISTRKIAYYFWSNVTFTVDSNPTKYTSPTPLPTESPTQPATPEPSIKPENTKDNFAPLAIAVGLVVAVTVVGLLVYLYKSRGKKT